MGVRKPRKDHGTAAKEPWHVPQGAHYFRWGDARQRESPADARPSGAPRIGVLSRPTPGPDTGNGCPTATRSHATPENSRGMPIRQRLGNDSGKENWSLVAFAEGSTGRANHPLECCRANSGLLSRESRFSTGVLSHKQIDNSINPTSRLRDKTPSCRVRTCVI